MSAFFDRLPPQSLKPVQFERHTRRPGLIRCVAIIAGSFVRWGISPAVAPMDRFRGFQGRKRAFLCRLLSSPHCEFPALSRVLS